MKCNLCGEEKKTYIVLGDKFVVCGCCALEKLEKVINLGDGLGGLQLLSMFGGKLTSILGVGHEKEEGSNHQRS